MKARGLAKLKKDGNDDKLKQIASKGGRTAHRNGTAHEFTPEEARIAGKMGGQKVKAQYGEEFYQQIGRKGGQARRGLRRM